MRYALEVTDGVELHSGSTPLPPGAITPIPNWDEICTIPYYYLKVLGNQIVEKTEAEQAAYDLAHPPTIEELQWEAFCFLHETDWYTCREEETGKPIPQEIKDARADARELL